MFGDFGGTGGATPSGLTSVSWLALCGGKSVRREEGYGGGRLGFVNGAFQDAMIAEGFGGRHGGQQRVLRGS